jgi:UDPglucose 6-dehydrogenase
LGVDIAEVAAGMGLDERIGRRFLHAGIGYGGSCFPKDTKALLDTAKREGTELSIIDRAVRVNETQAAYALDAWEAVVGSLAHKTVAVLGLAFKKDTDDMRESPALTVIKRLMERQAYIQAHDPLARLPDVRSYDRLKQFETIEAALYDADAAIIATDWRQYREADWARFRKLMKRPVILDGKNLLDRRMIRSLGYIYLGVGSGCTNPDIWTSGDAGHDPLEKRELS